MTFSERLAHRWITGRTDYASKLSSYTPTPILSSSTATNAGNVHNTFTTTTTSVGY